VGTGVLDNDDDDEVLIYYFLSKLTESGKNEISYFLSKLTESGKNEIRKEMTPKAKSIKVGMWKVERKRRSLWHRNKVYDSRKTLSLLANETRDWMRKKKTIN
jgi:hypothetical protein